MSISVSRSSCLLRPLRRSERWQAGLWIMLPASGAVSVLPYEVMDEAQLLDHGRRKDERIQVLRTDGPVHAVHGEDEGQPRGHHAVEFGARVGIEIDAGCQSFGRSSGCVHLDAEVTCQLE